MQKNDKEKIIIEEFISNDYDISENFNKFFANIAFYHCIFAYTCSFRRAKF